MTRREFLPIVGVLESATGKAFTDPQTDVWFDLLGDLPVSALQAAVKRALLESEYPGLPPIGRIRRLASEAINGLPETPDAAFDRVIRAVRCLGMDQAALAQQQLGEKTWQAVRGIGGWSALCNSTLTERGTLVAQFRDAWNRITEREQTTLRLPERLRPALPETDGPVLIGGPA